MLLSSDCITRLNEKVTSLRKNITHKILTAVNSEEVTSGLVSYILPSQWLVSSDTEADMISSAYFTYYAHG